MNTNLNTKKATMNLNHSPHIAKYIVLTYTIHIECIDEIVTSIKLYKSPEVKGYGEIKSLEKVKSHEETNSHRVHTPLTDMVAHQLQEYLEGIRKEFTFAWRAQGTDFQQRVWRALCEIPYGECRTYKDIATAIGSPLSSRAVGMACNRNPMMVIIPCHRVIGSNAKLVGYATGIDLKANLLDIEANNKTKLE